MKLIKIVFLIVFASFALLSCGGRQSGEPAGSQQIQPTAEKIAEPESKPAEDAAVLPEPEPLTEPWPQDDSETGDAPVSSLKDAPEVSSGDYSEAPPEGFSGKTGSESFLSVMIKQEESTEPSAVSISAIELPDDLFEDSEVSAVIMSPDLITNYQSAVIVKGVFSGFSDFTSAFWELSGTELTGELPRKNNEIFTFTVDMRGISETSVVKIRATSSQGKSAEDLIILTNDRTGPSLEITSPRNNSIINESASIQGRISNSASDSGISEIADASALIVGSGLPFPIEFDSSGTFSLNTAELISSSGIATPEDGAGQIIIKITASDFNNNLSTDYLSLYSQLPASGISITTPADGDKFGSDIVVEGSADGFSTLNWDIPGTGLSGSTQVENSAFSFPLKLSGLTDSFMLRIAANTPEKGMAIDTIRLYNNRISPELSLTAPVENDFYKDSIELIGRAGNETPEALETIKSLYWGIPGTENTGNLIFFDTDGKFNLILGTSAYSGLLPVEVVVEDYNNNRSNIILPLNDGNIEPKISLFLPKTKSEYGAFINIAGRITDPYAETVYGGITGVSYEIASTDDYDLIPVTDIFELDELNEFFVQVPAEELDGNQQLTITAEGMNGNKSNLIVNIEKSEFDITSFELSSTDNLLTASWRPVPDALSYSLLLTDDGSEPSIDNAAIYENITQPFSLGNIKNGHLYKARLSAQMEEAVFWSDTGETIPAGASTFKLSATGEFRQIKIDWANLSGADSYSIFRSGGNIDNFKKISEYIPESYYIDKDVIYGKEYFYYVSPDNHEYARSGAAGATIKKAPDQRIIPLNKLTNFIPKALKITGSYAYVAAGPDGLQIVDLTNPDRMSVTGSIAEFDVNALSIRGDYAYLACGSAGLQVVNIMDPTQPFIAGNRTTAGAVDICILGEYAYIADGESGIKVVNISDSRAPARTASIKDLNSTAVTLGNGYLFSNDNESVYAFDISNPSAPLEQASFEIPGVVDIAILENLCCIISKNAGLMIFNISDIENPVLLSKTLLSSPEACRIYNDYLYIADGRAGLKIYNISSPDSPELFENLRYINAVDVEVSDDNVFIAESTGLSAIQTFFNGVSFVVNKLVDQIEAACLSLFRNLLFIPSRDKGLQVMDISEPVSPETVEMPLHIEYSGISYISGNKLYTASAPDELSVFNIDPENGDFLEGPVYTEIIPGIIKDISTTAAETGELICISAGTDGVFFIKDEGIAGSIPAPDARACIIQNTTAYISDYREGLIVYDISDIGSPLHHADIEVKGSNSMSSSGGFLYITGKYGVSIFNIADERQPALIGEVKTFYAEKAVAKNNYLYIAEGYKGLTIYNIKAPAVPRLASTCDTIYAADFVIIDDYAVITDGTTLNTVRIFIPDWVK